MPAAESNPKFIEACRQICALLVAAEQAEQLPVTQETPAILPPAVLVGLAPLINSTEDLIWFVNPEKQLLLGNDASRSSFFNLPAVDVRPGMTSAELLPPSVAEYFDQVYQRALEGKILRFNHTAANGREYSMVAQPLKQKTANYAVSICGRDITEIHALQEELQRFEQVISSTPDLIAVVDHDHNHQIVNDSYLGAFNKTRQELIGSNLRELFGEMSFRRDSLLNLEIAFSGETVRTEAWVDLPEFGRRLMSLTFQPLRSQELVPKFVVINARDITAMKQAEDERQRIFDVSLDMLCVTGFDGCFKELNPAWTRTLGWAADELKNRPWTEFVLEDDQELALAADQRLQQGENLVGFESRYRCKNGAIKWLAWSSFPDPARQRVFSVIRDISVNKEMEEELRHLAATDPLTGANNRRHFIDHVNVELKRSRRYGQPLAVLVMDVDHFKVINDTHGHDVGDEVLIKLVDCCLEELRQTDLFGRYGGEEFAAALIQTDQAGALLVCERLCEKLRNMRIRTLQGELRLTVSVGLTMLTADDFTIDPVLKRADEALYRAKNSGRDQVVVY